MRRILLCLLLGRHDPATVFVKWNPDPMLGSTLSVCYRCGRVLP